MLRTAEHDKYKTHSHLPMLDEGFDTVCFSLTTKNVSDNGLNLLKTKEHKTRLRYYRSIASKTYGIPGYVILFTLHMGINLFSYWSQNTLCCGDKFFFNFYILCKQCMFKD